jgi:hypothetical protein
MSRKFSKYVRIAAVAVLVFIGAACNDGDDGDSVADIRGTPGAVHQPHPDPRVDQVTVRDGGLDPQQIMVQVGVPAQVQVRNRSDEKCTFFVGEYITGLEVSPGEEKMLSFTVPEIVSQNTVTMGCRGDGTRQGAAVIEFTGTRPGPGQ